MYKVSCSSHHDWYVLLHSNRPGDLKSFLPQTVSLLSLLVHIVRPFSDSPRSPSYTDTSEELVSLERDFVTSESNGLAATALNSGDEDVACVLVLSGDSFA